MYRLAYKVGWSVTYCGFNQLTLLKLKIQDLQAWSYHNLLLRINGHNIVKELFSDFTWRSVLSPCKFFMRQQANHLGQVFWHTWCSNWEVLQVLWPGYRAGGYAKGYRPDRGRETWTSFCGCVARIEQEACADQNRPCWLEQISRSSRRC